ncbi:MAG: rod shape-determining protein MreC [Bacillota bacterium]|nr:MAG: rod shape-determining protein MreC [Bacillota bacterium]MBS3949104.1 rod shape-determining protein MreC [Peptococcaceae bacterium]
MGFWGRNRQAITLVLTVFLLTGLLSFSARDQVGATLLEQGIRSAVAPLQRATAFVVSQGRDVGKFISDLVSAQAENERLKAELENLKFQFNNLVEASLEVERLQILLDYKIDQPGLNLVMGKVISRGLTSWQSEIIIDIGSLSDIAINDPVVTYSGAVGRITEVSASTAKALLITDPRSGLAAVVQDSRDGAVAEGDPSVPGMIRLTRLPRDFRVAVGDLVVTSGLGGVFPREHSFVIGTVSEIFISSDGLLKYARITPAVDFARLEEVLVLRKSRP